MERATEAFGTERATEAMENATEAMEQANLEQATEVMEQANLEQATEAMERVTEPAEATDMDGMMDALGLTPEEREAFAAIDSELMNVPVENGYGNAKVYGDCVHTTCSYTTTTYSCTWTKP